MRRLLNDEDLRLDGVADEVVVLGRGRDRHPDHPRLGQHAPLEPARDYERKVVEARRRRLIYPYEIIRLLTGGSAGNGSSAGESEPDLPPGKFEEYDLDPKVATPTAVSVGGRPYGMNTSSVVIGVIDTPTDKVFEGMQRVLVLSDPTIGMGSLAAPECDRIVAAIDLAEALARVLVTPGHDSRRGVRCQSPIGGISFPLAVAAIRGFDKLRPIDVGTWEVIGGRAGRFQNTPTGMAADDGVIARLHLY